jgi:hypothetical protein
VWIKHCPNEATNAIPQTFELVAFSSYQAPRERRTWGAELPRRGTLLLMRRGTSLFRTTTYGERSSVPEQAYRLLSAAYG